MMENNAPGRGKLKVTGIIYTVLGALSILGSLLILGAGGLLLASDNDVGLVLGAAAGVFSVLGAVSGVFYLVIGILGIRNCGRPENCGANFVLGVIVLVLVVIGLVVNVAVSGPTGTVWWDWCCPSSTSRAPSRIGTHGKRPNHETVAWKTVCPAWDTVFLSPGRGVDFLGKGWYNTLVCDAADSAGQYPAAKDVTG